MNRQINCKILIMEFLIEVNEFEHENENEKV